MHVRRSSSDARPSSRGLRSRLQCGESDSRNGPEQIDAINGQMLHELIHRRTDSCEYLHVESIKGCGLVVVHRSQTDQKLQVIDHDVLDASVHNLVLDRLKQSICT